MGAQRNFAETNLPFGSGISVTVKASSSQLKDQYRDFNFFDKLIIELKKFLFTASLLGVQH